MPQYRCQDCGVDLEYLNYRSDVIEYGSYSVEDGNRECNDSDYNGDTMFSCPECDYESYDESDIYEEVEEEEEEANDLSEQPRTNTVHGPLITITSTNINRCLECTKPTVTPLCVDCSNVNLY